jgi:hypothetical protein
MRALAAAWLAACLLVFAGVAHADAPDKGVADESRQLLVMLRAPAVHDRPDAGYAGDYRDAPGHAARVRLARRLAVAHGLRLRTDWPMPALGVDCFVLEAADAEGAARAAAALARDARVESVQPMQRFDVLSDAPRGGDPLFAAQPAAVEWRLRDLHAVTTGHGVTVAMIDSGVAATHPDLRGQVAASRDFVGDAPDARNVPERHGTEVAGLIAARADNRLGIAGVAPDARLLALRACRETGDDGAARCTSFTLAKALQFAIDRRAHVINLSLGGPRDALLARLLDVAMQRGASIVAAVDPRAPGGGFPASHPGVLAVAGDARRALPMQAVLAPATSLPTTTADGAWGLVDGASFAAAQVSGLVALLREMAPRTSAGALRDGLAPAAALGSGPVRPLPVDACAAVARASGACACGCRRVTQTEAMSRH